MGEIAVNMIKMKTAELIGPALDWAVAKALGGEHKPFRFASNDNAPMDMAWVFPHGYACTRWSPSTDWSQGGPLIDKYKACLAEIGDGLWCVAFEPGERFCNWDDSGYGNTPLIAVCRAIVREKLGIEVSVPAELVSP